MDSLLADSEGVICGYYFNNSKRVKIILKNKNPYPNLNYIYSKKYKNLIDILMLLEKENKKIYAKIVRKNGKIIF